MKWSDPNKRLTRESAFSMLVLLRERFPNGFTLEEAEEYLWSVYKKQRQASNN